MNLLRIGMYLFAFSGLLLATAYIAQKIVAWRTAEDAQGLSGNLLKGVSSLIATGGVVLFASRMTPENLLRQLQIGLAVIGIGGLVIGNTYLVQLYLRGKNLPRNEGTYLGITGFACLLAAIAVFLIAISITQL